MALSSSVPLSDPSPPVHRLPRGTLLLKDTLLEGVDGVSCDEEGLRGPEAAESRRQVCEAGIVCAGGKINAQLDCCSSGTPLRKGLVAVHQRHGDSGTIRV